MAIHLVCIGAALRRKQRSTDLDRKLRRCLGVILPKSFSLPVAPNPIGAACELAEQYRDIRPTEELRNYFWKQLQQTFGERVCLNGKIENSLPNTLSVSFVRCHGSRILSLMPNVAASTGSACHSGKIQSSAVLIAMRKSSAIANGTIRFSLGRATSKEEVDIVIEQLKKNI